MAELQGPDQQAWLTHAWLCERLNSPALPTLRKSTSSCKGACWHCLLLLCLGWVPLPHPRSPVCRAHERQGCGARHSQIGCLPSCSSVSLGAGPQVSASIQWADRLPLAVPWRRVREPNRGSHRAAHVDGAGEVTAAVVFHCSCCDHRHHCCHWHQLQKSKERRSRRAGTQQPAAFIFPWLLQAQPKLTSLVRWPGLPSAPQKHRCPARWWRVEP